MFSPGADTYPLISGGSFSSADAHANAGSNALFPFSSKPYQYPFSPLLETQSSAEASAFANNNLQGNLYSPGSSYASSEAIAQAQSNSEPSSYLYPGGYNMGGTSSAVAEAETNSNSEYGQYFPYSSPGSSSSALADAQAYNGPGLSPLTYLQYSQPGLSYLPTSSLAAAEADAIANSGYNSILPGHLSSLGHQSGFTQSELANALSNLKINPLRLQTLPNGSPVFGSAGSEAMANSNSGYNPYLSQLYPSSGPSYMQGSAYSSAESEASSGLNQLGGSMSSALSEANTVSNSINPFLHQPSSNIGFPSGFSQSGAMANANSGLSSGYLPWSPAPALAEAEALSDVNSGLNSLLYSPYSNLNPSYLTSSSADAESLSNVNTGYYPSGSIGSPGSSASALAESEAVSGNNPGLYPSLYSSYPNVQPYQSGYSMGAAEAQALANANSGHNELLPNIYSGYGADSSASALAEAASNSGYSSLLPGSYSNAEAIANANSGSYLSPYSSGSSSSAEAEAIANANSGYSQPMMYPGGLFSGLPSNSYASANALSEASSVMNSPYYNSSPYGNSYLNSPESSISSASAQALANTAGYGHSSKYINSVSHFNSNSIVAFGTIWMFCHFIVGYKNSNFSNTIILLQDCSKSI